MISGQKGLPWTRFFDTFGGYHEKRIFTGVGCFSAAGWLRLRRLGASLRFPTRSARPLERWWLGKTVCQSAKKGRVANAPVVAAKFG